MPHRGAQCCPNEAGVHLSCCADTPTPTLAPVTPWPTHAPTNTPTHAPNFDRGLCANVPACAFLVDGEHSAGAAATARCCPAANGERFACCPQLIASDDCIGHHNLH